jgi:hypothetical protein
VSLYAPDLLARITACGLSERDCNIRMEHAVNTWLKRKGLYSTTVNEQRAATMKQVWETRKARRAAAAAPAA